MCVCAAVIFFVEFLGDLFWFVFVFIFITWVSISVYFTKTRFVFFFYSHTHNAAHDTQSEIVASMSAISFGLNNFFFWFYFFFRLSSFVVLFVQLILRLMCTKSVIRVVWASNQRKSTENKQMICVSRSFGVWYLQNRFSPLHREKTVSMGHKQRFQEGAKIFYWICVQMVTEGMYILNCCRTGTAILARDCQIDGWFLHWLHHPNSHAHTIHYPFLIRVLALFATTRFCSPARSS